MVGLLHRPAGRFATLMLALLVASFALTLLGASRALASSGGCGTLDTPAAGVGSVYVSFYGCTSIAGATTIDLLPHSAVGAGPTSCDEVATIYEDSSTTPIGTRNMACNLNGSPATVITVTPGHHYTFTWYMYLVVHGAAYYSTIDSSPALDLPYGTCSDKYCQLGAQDTDSQDGLVDTIQFVIDVPTATQTEVDDTASVGWDFVKLDNGYQFQAGYWFGCPGGKAMPFTQAFYTTPTPAKMVESTMGTKQCGLTGKHTFQIKGVGKNSSGLAQFKAYMDGKLLTDGKSGAEAVVTTNSAMTTTSKGLPYAAAELTSGSIHPSGADVMGPYTFTAAFQSWYPPLAVGTWHSSASATSYSQNTICPPFNVAKRAANSFATGTLGGSCIPDGTVLWP